MIVYLNGQFIPEERAVVSIHDRCFRYGDGLFEAILVVNGKTFRTPQHLRRLRGAADQLRMSLPWSDEDISAAILELAQRNALPNGVARIQLSRGAGPRGYAPTGQEQPVLIITLHPTAGLAAPEGPHWKLVVASLRVPAGSRLSQAKHCSRLLNVMAAMEARERGADEALLLETNGNVAEGGSSNVFWVKAGKLHTPPLTESLLPGVTRLEVSELAVQLSVEFGEATATINDLFSAEGVFVTFTSRGVIEVVELEGIPLARSPLTGRFQKAFQELVARECAA